MNHKDPDILAENPEGVSELPEDISELPDGISELAEDISEKRFDISELPSGISELPDEISEPQEGVSELPSGVSELTEDISGLSEGISEFGDAISQAGEKNPVATAPGSDLDDDAPSRRDQSRSTAELMAVVEALVFVADEPLTAKLLADLLGEEKDAVLAAVEGLADEYDNRESGLQIREIAGGWQLATRTQYHEEVRKFLKTRPSAKLSLASLETLAVIAYKQPVTVPEILEIRGVQSASAIKTLLEKRLIITKGHKETVGRPMMYGTSKDFLIQFGLKDLTELPSIEDFEDLAGSI